MTDEPFDLDQYAVEEATADALLLAADIVAMATRMEKAPAGSPEQNELADQTLLLIKRFEAIETLPVPSRMFAMARVSARLLNGLADRAGADGPKIAGRYADALKAQRDER
jgi:hypothetical protein